MTVYWNTVNILYYSIILFYLSLYFFLVPGRFAKYLETVQLTYGMKK